MNFVQPVRGKIRKWVDAFLRSHHDHYTCSLPKDWGCFSPLSLILKSLFSHVSTNSTQTAFLKTLKDESFIVYVSKYKSNFEYLFYHIKYKSEGLPFPQFGFDYTILIWQRLSRLIRIALAHLDHLLRHKTLPDPYVSGFFKRELESGKAAFLSLVDRKGFYHRFVKAKRDPLEYLIELQHEISRPIHIIPQWLLFSKKPQDVPLGLVDIFFGSEENPGRLRRWMAILRTPQKAFVETSDPLNLLSFVQKADNQERSAQQQAFVLRQMLLDQINRHRQSITGPVLKTRVELKELILRNERFQDFMRGYAQTGKKNLADLHKKADEDLNDIAADYSPHFIQAISMIFGWIWKTMFDGIVLDMEGLNRVKSAATRAPIVFVPCHRSHFDYLILSHVLITNNMPCPHVTAGQNLAFWPVGTLFRKSGAFFIRRSFHGARLYAQVFSEYVRMLIQQGFNIEFFIEGGRSRTGKMALPKTGLLTILIEAYKTGACQDLIFAPVYVGYDRLLEESAILGELEGREKKQESFAQLIRARKLLNKRHGRVYVQFDEPISLKALVSEAGKSLQDMEHAEYQALGRNLAYRIINAVNRISVVTSQAITASAILNYPKHSFTQSDLMTCVETYLNYLIFHNARLSENLDDTLLGIKNVLAIYSKRKFVEKQKIKAKDEPPPADPRYVASENKRMNLEYYKNNCIHHFVPAAYTALAILSYDAFQFSASALHSDYNFLQEFFKYEFAYDVEKTPEYMVRKTLKAFIDDAILMPHPTLPDTYNITSAGLRKLLFFAGFLKTYFESYRVVLDVLKGYGRRELVKKERMKKIRALGDQLYKQQEVERREALSHINYENGLTFFNFKGIRGNEDQQGIEFYSQVIRKYLNCFMVQK
ncbi:MAG: 1-acyl-sn-glycerol-3-phosphate acyltransferase [Deltaproteobacteria bacterium]|nr:1-acyl-sn-glycerol-3-phosphate acyltransferase [Deltaproteobacteria bacterium]